MQSENNSEKIALGNSTQPGENVGATQKEVASEWDKQFKQWFSRTQYLDDIADALTNFGYQKIYEGIDYVVFSIDNAELVLDYNNPRDNNPRVYAREKGF